MIDTMLKDAMPLQGFAGGLMIGLAAAVMLLGLGRIAGVSSIAARAARIASEGMPWASATAFIVGLPLGAAVVALTAGPVTARYPPSLIVLLAGGLLVGFSTRLGSGCTSGHGVCGMSRLSRRSLLATAIFMGTGFATVALMNRLGLGW